MAETSWRKKPSWMGRIWTDEDDREMSLLEKEHSFLSESTKTCMYRMKSGKCQVAGWGQNNDDLCLEREVRLGW